MAVTIYDIAEHVGKSPATVSLALNNSRRISNSTAENIRLVARRLGYAPNTMARGLVNGKTCTLGFIFNHTSQDLAYDHSIMELFHCVAQEASKHGYRVFFHNSTLSTRLDEVIPEVKSYGLDGMIICTDLYDSDRDYLATLETPAVIVGRNYTAKRVSSVSFDGLGGAKMLVDHLVSLGHRKIGFVGKNNTETSVIRFKGFKDALQGHGLAVDESCVIECSYDMDAGELAALKLARLRDNVPTAVIGATDMLCYGLLSGFYEKGISVPHDVSIVGFDNLHISHICLPHLTTIDLSRSKAAAASMDLMFKLLKNKAGQNLKVPCKLVLRDSSAQVEI